MNKQMNNKQVYTTSYACLVLALTILMLFGTAQPASATTVTTNTNLGWQTVLNQNYSTMQSIPNNIFLSGYLTGASYGVVNQTTKITTSGLILNITDPGYLGELFIGQLYPAGHVLYHINMSMNTSGNGNAETFLQFGNLALIGILNRIDSYGVYLYYYDATGALSSYNFLTKTSEFADIYVEYFPNGTTTISDAYDPTSKISMSQISNVNIKHFHNGTTILYNIHNPTSKKYILTKSSANPLVNINASGKNKSGTNPLVNINALASNQITASYQQVVPYNYLSTNTIAIDTYLSSLSNMSVTFNSFSEQVPKNLITVFAQNNTFPFGFDGPRPNYIYGADWFKTHNLSTTVWVDHGAYTAENASQQAYLRDLFNNHLFEVGVHFSTMLDFDPNPNATMDTEVSDIRSYFNTSPLSWSSLADADNVTHAQRMWNLYGAFWRNAPQSIEAFPEIGNMYTGQLGNDSTANTTFFWNTASQHKTFIPAFTHSVSNPFEGYSLSILDFTNIFSNYTNSGVIIEPYAKWYQENNNTVQPITNVCFSPTSSYFNINTTGYNATTQINDPNGGGNLWYTIGGGWLINTIVSDSNVTNMKINTPSNLTVHKANANIIPASGSIDVNISTYNINGTVKFNESSSSLQVAYNIGDRIPNQPYTVNIYWDNGTIYQNFKIFADSAGYIHYNSTGFQNPRYQEIEVQTVETYTITTVTNLDSIDVNISTYNINGTVKFNESSSNSSLQVTYNIGDRIPNQPYTVNIYWDNGTIYQNFKKYADGAGYIHYNSTGFQNPRYQDIE